MGQLSIFGVIILLAGVNFMRYGRREKPRKNFTRFFLIFMFMVWWKLFQTKWNELKEIPWLFIRVLCCDEIFFRKWIWMAIQKPLTVRRIIQICLADSSILFNIFTIDAWFFLCFFFEASTIVWIWSKAFFLF